MKSLMERKSLGTLADLRDNSELQAGATWHHSELFTDLFYRKSERWWLLY